MNIEPLVYNSKIYRTFKINHYAVTRIKREAETLVKSLA